MRSSWKESFEVQTCQISQAKIFMLLSISGVLF